MLKIADFRPGLEIEAKTIRGRRRVIGCQWDGVGDIERFIVPNHSSWRDDPKQLWVNAEDVTAAHLPARDVTYEATKGKRE